MKRLKAFFVTTFLGGVVVILPGAILAFVFSWLFGVMRGLIQPAGQLVKARSSLPEYAADAVVALVIVAGCFAVGLVVRTRIGMFAWSNIEDRILKVAPGYTAVKEAVNQLLGRKKPFSTVALVKMGDGALATAFVTDQHESGVWTVFVPMGPNPTSGLVLHVAKERVQVIPEPGQDALRTVISCGAGSSRLVEAWLRASGKEARG
ncbi:MAG TPA: DUF502 domain-containing protein [Candidatus Brocadiia bacterium]|nr:DUF502 domain-containing protein [Candidatus Brocadiia bacterium]